MSLNELQEAAMQLPPMQRQELIVFLLSQQSAPPKSPRKMRILGAVESDFQAADSEAILHKKWSELP